MFYGNQNKKTLLNILHLLFIVFCTNAVIAQKNLSPADFLKKFEITNPSGISKPGNNFYWQIEKDFILVPVNKTKKNAEKYLQPLFNDTLLKYYSYARFFYGTLLCNYEFNNGLLPFIGYVDNSSACIYKKPSYNGNDKKWMQKIAATQFPNKTALENGALALCNMLYKLSTPNIINCNNQYIYGTPLLAWNADTLKITYSYTDSCENLEYYNPQPIKEKWEFTNTAKLLIHNLHIMDIILDRYW